MLEYGGKTCSSPKQATQVAANGEKYRTQLVITFRSTLAPNPPVSPRQPRTTHVHDDRGGEVGFSVTVKCSG